MVGSGRYLRKTHNWELRRPTLGGSARYLRKNIVGGQRRPTLVRCERYYYRTSVGGKGARRRSICVFFDSIGYLTLGLRMALRPDAIPLGACCDVEDACGIHCVLWRSIISSGVAPERFLRRGYMRRAAHRPFSPG